MAKPRRKNISREIRDIRFPTAHVPEKSAAAEAPVRSIRAPQAGDSMPSPRRAPIVPPRRTLLKRPLLIFAGVIVIGAIVGGFFWYRSTVARAFQLRAAMIAAFHMQGGIQIPDTGSVDGASTTATLPTTATGWMSYIQGFLSSVGDLGQSSFQAISAASQASTIAQQLPLAIFQKNGPLLVSDLQTLQSDLGTMDAALQNIKKNGNANSGASGGGINSLVPNLSAYTAYEPDVAEAQRAVSALLALVQASGDHHIIVLFGNSAELRPGGGFLGSFADIDFGSSTINSIDVHDINDVDRTFGPNIVPPKPLQRIESYWVPSDANWFFDYPTSAAKVLQFMGESSLYASSTASGGATPGSAPATPTFDGAILISPKVIQDVLKITGPVTLADSSTTVTADNVVALIQSQVQAGQANGAAAPKQILSDLLPALEAQLQNLSPDAAQQFLGAAAQWIMNKDLEIYMAGGANVAGTGGGTNTADATLAQVAAYYNADGALFPTPRNFEGDYVAAVNANVGGGKSDAVIDDSVKVESDLRSDGVVTDHVTFGRGNNATADDAWWYRVTNQDYVQLFTPPGATLNSVNITGPALAAARTCAQKKCGTAIDPTLSGVESTLTALSGISGVTIGGSAAVSQFKESGKNVFASWLVTPAGDSESASFTYQRAIGAPFQDGAPYTFVYERQSGAQQSLDVVLNAPPGFVWQQGGVSKYEYVEPYAPGRLVITLNLQKL